MIIREGRDLSRIDLAGHLVQIPHRIVEHADLERARVHELDGAAVVAREADPRMHVIRLLAPPLEGEDHSKDIDFSPAGIRRRWDTGYADTQRVLAQAPWTDDFDPLEGFILHEAAGGVMTHETPEVGEPVDAAAEREEEIGHAADEGWLSSAATYGARPLMPAGAASSHAHRRSR